MGSDCTHMSSNFTHDARVKRGRSIGGKLRSQYRTKFLKNPRIPRKCMRCKLCEFICDNESSTLSICVVWVAHCFFRLVSPLQVGGFLLASAVTTVVRTALPKEDVNEWGWRIPFWVSLLLAPLLYNIVSHTEESKFWAERAEQKETEQLIREK